MRAKSKARPPLARGRPSLVNFDDRYIFVCGGRNLSDTRDFLKSVDRYDAKLDKWGDTKKQPTLKIGRMSHSSCALGDFIYVLAGYNLKNKVLDGMERMNARTQIEGTRTQWAEIKLKIGTFPTRLDPIFCPIADTELLVMGGFNGFP